MVRSVVSPNVQLSGEISIVRMSILSLEMTTKRVEYDYSVF